jgi:DnaK suppressor protein
MQKKATAAAKTAKGKAPATKAPAKSAATKSAAAKAPAAKSTTPAKATPAKVAAVKAAARPAEKKSPAAKSAPGNAVAAGTVAKTPAARPAKEDSKTVAVKKAEAPAKKTTPAKARAKGDRAAFYAKQRELLLEERSSYIISAESLKAQADSLALEHEPGDVQFDEEGGEGGTANVDREIDLYLSAQARATVVEIDRALQKIEDGHYGMCEHCGEVIPDARLQALPYASLCVTCKSGGLSSRR